jgi:hypothetical protein
MPATSASATAIRKVILFLGIRREIVGMSPATSAHHLNVTPTIGPFSERSCTDWSDFMSYFM